MGICLPIKQPPQRKLIKAMALCPSCKKGNCKQHTKDYMSKGNVTLCKCSKCCGLGVVLKVAEKVFKNEPVLLPEKPKAIEFPTNPFGFDGSTMLLMETGRLTKAGFIFEFWRGNRNTYCHKLYDQIKELLESKSYMVKEEVHYKLLLNSFDKVCLSVWARKDKFTIEEMKKLILKTMNDIQSNIVNNCILIMPD